MMYRVVRRYGCDVELDSVTDRICAVWGCQAHVMARSCLVDGLGDSGVCGHLSGVGRIPGHIQSGVLADCARIHGRHGALFRAIGALTGNVSSEGFPPFRHKHMTHATMAGNLAITPLLPFRISQHGQHATALIRLGQWDAMQITPTGVEDRVTPGPRANRGREGVEPCLDSRRDPVKTIRHIELLPLLKDHDLAEHIPLAVERSVRPNPGLIEGLTLLGLRKHVGEYRAKVYGFVPIVVHSKTGGRMVSRSDGHRVSSLMCPWIPLTYGRCRVAGTGLEDPSLACARANTAWTR